MPSSEQELRDEALRLIKGSPQPELGLDGLAERMGVDRSRAEELVARLEREGRLLRDGDRLVVVERSTFDAPPDEPIP